MVAVALYQALEAEEGRGVHAGQPGIRQASTQPVPTKAKRWSGVTRTDVLSDPAAGRIWSKSRSERSRYTGSGVARPKGQTPPTGWPVKASISSAPSMRGRALNIALILWLSS